MAQQLPQLGSREARIARLLACTDFRLDMKGLSQLTGYQERYLENLLRRIRKTGREYWPLHIRDLRPLRLGSLLLRSSRAIPGNPSSITDLEKLGVPVARYLHSYRVLMDNYAVYSYTVPDQLRDTIVSQVTRILEHTVYDTGYTVPIKPPCRLDRPRLEDVYKLLVSEGGEEHYAQLLEKKPEQIDYGLVELYLYAKLDLDPLSTITGLQDPSDVLKEREVECQRRLRMRRQRIRDAYERLSSRGFIGRVLLMRLIWMGEDPIPFYVEVERSCAPRLYGIASQLLLAPSIFVGEQVAAASMILPDRLTEPVRRLLSGCKVYNNVIASGFGTTVPLEMYVPGRGWSTDPAPLPQILWGQGLADYVE